MSESEDLIPRREKAFNSENYIESTDNDEVISVNEDVHISPSVFERIVSEDPSYTVQYCTTLAATFGALAMGTVLGFSSPVEPLLKNATDNNIVLSPKEISWFSSSVSLGALAGGPLGGFCIDSFGRRGTMIFSVVPFLIGWGLIAGAQNFLMLLIGRIVTGLCCGITSLVVPTYIGEFSSPKIRGTLGSAFQLMVVIGVLYSYAFGSIFRCYRYLALTCAVIPCFFSLFMLFCKESPTYLIRKKEEQRAREALQHFRGPHYDISQEFNQLTRSGFNDANTRLRLRDLKVRRIYCPLIISLSLMFFQQLSGINAILFNLNAIFLSSGVKMSESLSSILVAVTQVIATLVGMCLMDKLGRRTLLMLSSLFMSISLIALGGFFYEKAHSSLNVVDNLGWLPLTSLVVFIIAFSVGFGPVPWIMMSELFSSDIRDFASSVSTCTNWTLAFIVTLTFQTVEDVICDYGAYWSFASFCFLSLVFCFFFVPETKGKSTDEIASMFGRDSDRHHRIT